MRMNGNETPFYKIGEVCERPQYTFTDSSPHAKHIDEDYFMDAKYEFYGVHTKCSIDGINFHEVYVPDIASAAGAGDTYEEALGSSAEIMAIRLQEMKTRGEHIPAPRSKGQVEEHGRKRATEQIAGFEIQFCDVVAIPEFIGPVQEMSESELAQLNEEMQAKWHALEGDACVDHSSI
jgi:predicted RNase H-like HicB family nuclease